MQCMSIALRGDNIMSSLPSLYMSPSVSVSSTDGEEGECDARSGSSSGNVAILGATTLLDLLALVRFDVTTVASSKCGLILPAEDNLPVGMPLVVPHVLGLTLFVRRRCNEFSGGRIENPPHHRYWRHSHMERDP